MSNEKKVLMKIEHLTKEFEIKSKKLGGKPQIAPLCVPRFGAISFLR